MPKNLFKTWLLCLILGFQILAAYGDHLTSFQAKFIQTTYQNQEKIIYKGHLIAKRDHMAKWTYESPLKKEIYLNDSMVIVYEPALLQATTSKLKHNIDLFSIIQESKLQTKQKDHHIYSATIGDTTYYLEVKDDIPSRIIYNDHFNNRVEIQFVEQKINRDIPDSKFIFRPPEGIDFIEQ